MSVDRLATHQRAVQSPAKSVDTERKCVDKSHTEAEKGAGGIDWCVDWMMFILCIPRLFGVAPCGVFHSKTPAYFGL